MRIAIFTKIPVFPTTGGNRARILTLVNALQALGHEVTFVLFPSRQMERFDEAAHVALFGAHDFILLNQGKFIKFLKNINIVYHIVKYKVRKKLGLSKSKEGNIDYIVPKFLMRDAYRKVKEIKFDCVIAEYVHYSGILGFYPSSVRKIIDTHDCFSEEFTAGAEAKGLARADVVLAIQEKERAYFDAILKAHTPGARTATHLVGHFVEPGVPVEQGRSEGATFLGSNFEANRVSLDWFVAQVLPEILAEAPEFVLTVAGTICDTLAPHPSIRALGTVPQVCDAFAASPVLINPIQAGTGLKIKLIDAMSNGIPSISTQKGVEGITPESLQGVLVVADDDAKGFAKATLRLYRDVALRTRLGQSAFASACAMKDAQIRALQAAIRREVQQEEPVFLKHPVGLVASMA